MTLALAVAAPRKEAPSVLRTCNFLYIFCIKFVLIEGLSVELIRRSATSNVNTNTLIASDYSLTLEDPFTLLCRLITVWSCFALPVFILHTALRPVLFLEHSPFVQSQLGAYAELVDEMQSPKQNVGELFVSALEDAPEHSRKEMRC